MGLRDEIKRLEGLVVRDTARYEDSIKNNTAKLAKYGGQHPADSKEYKAFKEYIDRDNARLSQALAALKQP